MSIGYRLIYKEAFERWLRHNEPRIGVSNTLTTRNSFIYAAYREVYTHDAKKSAQDLITSMDNNTASNAKKENKRKRIAVSERLTKGRRLKREHQRGLNNDGKMKVTNIYSMYWAGFIMARFMA